MTGDWASTVVKGSKVPVPVLTLIIEFEAGAPVQHHVHSHPESHAESEELDHLFWNATFEVGDEVH